MTLSRFGAPLTIYALELFGGKYYIGKTRDLNNQLRRHFRPSDICHGDPCGVAWLQQWRPMRIDHLYRNAHDLDLDKLTLKYMQKYGINNVRGGTYSSTDLSVNQMAQIQRRLIYGEDEGVAEKRVLYV